VAKLVPLPLTASCFSKIQIGLPFWYRLTRVVPDKGPLNECVCVCVCVCGQRRSWSVPAYALQVGNGGADDHRGQRVTRRRRRPPSDRPCSTQRQRPHAPARRRPHAAAADSKPWCMHQVVSLSSVTLLAAFIAESVKRRSGVCPSDRLSLRLSVCLSVLSFHNVKSSSASASIRLVPPVLWPSRPTGMLYVLYVIYVYLVFRNVIYRPFAYF